MARGAKWMKGLIGAAVVAGLAAAKKSAAQTVTETADKLANSLSGDASLGGFGSYYSPDLWGILRQYPELWASSKASEMGWDNTPPSELWAPMVGLVGLRAAISARWPGGRVTSGYRSPQVNAAVGGASNSQHLRGRAIDLVWDGAGNDKRKSLARQIHALGSVTDVTGRRWPIGQVIAYEVGRPGPSVHVALAESGINSSLLFAPMGGGYESLQS